MNWSAVKRRNTRQSAKKAKRERTAMERKARIEKAGGVVAVGELRAAKREVRKCRDTFYAIDFEVEVWALRGAEWRIDKAPWCDVPVMVPHIEYRERPDASKSIPLTPGAAKWVMVEWAKAKGVS